MMHGEKNIKFSFEIYKFKSHKVSRMVDKVFKFCSVRWWIRRLWKISLCSNTNCYSV